jgi:hypothetical protein
VIAPSKVIAILESKIALMKSLGDEKINGFAIIIPPEGEVIHFTTMGSEADQKAFFEYLYNKMKATTEANQLGGVRMPR